MGRIRNFIHFIFVALCSFRTNVVGGLRMKVTKSQMKIKDEGNNDSFNL